MLPEGFVRRMVAERGEAQAQALFAALEGEPPASLRIHPQKGSAPEGGVPVPWSRWGYYLPRRPLFTLDPAFHAGCYYVQEASSQFVGYLLEGVPVAGARILDLCAAPGGKTTLYASLAGEGGLVVANEIDRRRAHVLADNVRKWGTGNTLVTLGEPARIARLEAWFDVVAVDAPCSGEGMFRKDAAARGEWSEGAVALCARRQSEILREAWRALRPGGMLIYSTCTFNRAENEEVLEGFAAWAGAALEEVPPVVCDPAWGIEEGRAGAFGTYRFFPHRTRGEGFFAAAARKAGDAGVRCRAPKARGGALRTVGKAEAAELARWVREPARMHFFAAGDTCYACHAEQAEAVRQVSEAAAAIYAGTALGQLFHGRLKPDPALAFSCELNRGAVPEAVLEEPEALAYLRREEVAPERFAEGMNLVVCGGAGLGYAKRIGRRVNNLYPNSLRIVNL